MILGRLKSFPVVGNGYQVVTRVVFTPTVVIEQPVSAQHAVFDTLDQMWKQFDRFGGFLTGYKGLLRVRMMNLNMQNVHRYQDQYEEKRTEKKTVDQKIRKIQEQRTMIQGSINIFKPLETSCVAKMQRCAKLQEEEEHLKSASDALEAEADQIWKKLRTDLSTIEMRHQNLKLSLVYLTLGISVGLIWIYKANMKQNDHKEVLKRMDSYFQKEHKSWGSTFYDWGAWAASPIKKLPSGSAFYDWGAWAVSPVKKLKFW